ncbi:alpha/beta hydrolase [Paenibacillus doosanensis]|nr:alpha/beta hydrolase [Paenibacillus doosanensis]
MATVNGAVLHYDSVGTGVPIVFIHPPLLTGEVFVFQRELRDRFRIITFDVRGHGLTKPEGAITYAAIAADVVGLLDALNIPKAYVCGYSTGGSAALEAMLAYPERFAGAILISAMPEINDWYNKFRLWTACQMCKMSAKRLLSAAIAMGNADCRSTFRRLYEGAMRGDIRSMRQYFDCSYASNVTGRLTSIRVPVLLVYGEKDISFHHYARMIQTRVPDCAFHLIAGAKHEIPTRNARELNELIRLWLAEPALQPLEEERVQDGRDENPLEVPDVMMPGLPEEGRELPDAR